MSQTNPVPVTDPHHVREVYANEVVAYGQMDGVVHLTLGMQRFDGMRDTGEVQQAREIVCRLALSSSAFDALLEGLTRMKLALAGSESLRTSSESTSKAH